MDVIIAQHVALTCHANAFLQGRSIRRFLETNSTCRCCERVDFRGAQWRPDGSEQETHIASSPDDWFHYLRSLGARGVRLSHSQKQPAVSERVAERLLCGTRTWLMEVLLPNGQSDYWLSHWQTGRKNTSQERRWEVTYFQAARQATSRVGPEDLASVMMQVTRSLREIHDFALRHDIPEFSESFAEALDALGSEDKAFRGYHEDIAPTGMLPQEAATVLYACQRAWIFEGVGPWHDVLSEDAIRTECERLSVQLFEALRNGIVAGANASYYGCVSALNK